MSVLFFTEKVKKSLEKDDVKYEDAKIERFSESSDTYRAMYQESQELWAGKTGIIINKKAGNMIIGPVGYSEPFSSMKFGSVFRGHPLTSTTLPSTINTPIPMFTYDFPFRNLKDLILSPIMDTLMSLF